MAGPVRADQCESPFSVAQLAGTTKVSGYRLHCTGNATVAGDWALHANWGATGHVNAVTGNDQIGSMNLDATGGSQGANPTATLTFGDGTFTSAPIALVVGYNITDPTEAVTCTWTTTATTLVITLTNPGTPTADERYEFRYIVLGV